MKNFIEAMKNPKKKATAQLMFYFVFFLFLIIIFNSSSTQRPNVSYKDITVNEYNYTYKINENVLNGIHTKDTDYFIFNNNTYTLTNNIYVDINNNIFNLESIDINKFSYDSIEKIINSLQYLESTSYNDLTTKTIYEVPYSSFGIENNLNLNLVVYKDSDKYITKCEMTYLNYNVILEYKKR